MSRASVVGFSLSLVLTLFLFDGSTEGIVVFLLRYQISIPLLESRSSSLYFDADVACNPWPLVGKCMYDHCGDDVVDGLINEAGD